MVARSNPQGWWVPPPKRLPSKPVWGQKDTTTDPKQFAPTSPPLPAPTRTSGRGRKGPAPVVWVCPSPPGGGVPTLCMHISYM